MIARFLLVFALFIGAANAQTLGFSHATMWSGQKTWADAVATVRAAYSTNFNINNQTPTAEPTAAGSVNLQLYLVRKSDGYSYWQSNTLTGAAWPACPNGQTRQSDGTCGCPSGMIQSVGGQCVCPGVQVYQNGACACPPQPAWKGVPISGTGSQPASVCFDGCRAPTAGLGVEMGGNWAAQLGAFTGEKCTTDAPGSGLPNEKPKAKTPTTDDRTPAQKCLAQGQGYVTTSNGTTCVAPSDSPNPLTKKATETITKTVPGNPGASSVVEKTTTCVGAECTTTETTKDGNGTVTSTGTRTGTGKGTGNGDGDTDCDKYPDSIGCAKFGGPDGGDTLQEQSVGVSSIGVVSVGSSATCPAPLQLPKGMTFSFTPYCDFASGLRPIIIALAWLSAGFLIFGFRQS